MVSANGSITNLHEEENITTTTTNAAEVVEQATYDYTAGETSRFLSALFSYLSILKNTWKHKIENAKWMFLSEVKNDLFRLAKMRQQAKQQKKAASESYRDSLSLQTFFSKNKEFDCDAQSFASNSKDMKKR